MAHPFYEQFNRMLAGRGFDEFVEQQCSHLYAQKVGRPSLAPGQYFRLLLIGYFEGIDSEGGIAWRAADSLGLRGFLGVGLNQMPPDHSTISRTRRQIDVETHQAVFGWVLKLLAEKGLLKGKTVGVDGTSLEANAALRSIVRRDTGEGYQEFLTRLAQESGVATPTREQLAKLDRKRARKGSNEDWVNPHDPEASIKKRLGQSCRSPEYDLVCPAPRRGTGRYSQPVAPLADGGLFVCPLDHPVNSRNRYASLGVQC